ncbi:hypothetical protein K488DRAFT_91629 [Vararia minispora EC-137]|uniref:Uncharacterized protein n=1 Tax=Vararia minispora EC-137 TaxID=1314806 RepID=A0ACB8Q5Q2_9AGAM|nr:hypothetical protein K488DRAFT_91629 [Vararia minispora EC-137]
MLVLALSSQSFVLGTNWNAGARSVIVRWPSGRRDTLLRILMGGIWGRFQTELLQGLWPYNCRCWSVWKQERNVENEDARTPESLQLLAPVQVQALDLSCPAHDLYITRALSAHHPHIVALERSSCPASLDSARPTLFGDSFLSESGFGGIGTSSIADDFSAPPCVPLCALSTLPFPQVAPSATSAPMLSLHRGGLLRPSHRRPAAAVSTHPPCCLLLSLLSPFLASTPPVPSLSTTPYPPLTPVAPQILRAHKRRHHCQCVCALRVGRSAHSPAQLKPVLTDSAAAASAFIVLASDVPLRR